MPTSTDLIGCGWAFPPTLNNGLVEMTSGEAEIVQAIQIILETPAGSRVMRPAFGSRLHELVFAPINAATMTAARHYVAEALGYWEPRIDVLGVEVQPYPVNWGNSADSAFKAFDDPTAVLLIQVNFRIRATYDERSLVVPFYTIPGEAS